MGLYYLLNQGIYVYGKSSKTAQRKYLSFTLKMKLNGDTNITKIIDNVSHITFVLSHI